MMFAAVINAIRFLLYASEKKRVIPSSARVLQLHFFPPLKRYLHIHTHTQYIYIYIYKMSAMDIEEEQRPTENTGSSATTRVIVSSLQASSGLSISM